MKIVTLISGGLDSTVLAYMLAAEGMTQTLLFINYGQKHIKEHFEAMECADALGLRLENVAITGEVIFRSDTVVVPNRNLVMANLAAALAVSLNYDGIALGIQQGDHEVFPDCRPEFVTALEQLLYVATGRRLQVYAPLIHHTKAEIVVLGDVLGVPFKDTWTCYEGRELHCGVCLACKGRKAAFEAAGMDDPVRYEQ